MVQVGVLQVHWPSAECSCEPEYSYLHHNFATKVRESGAGDDMTYFGKGGLVTMVYYDGTQPPTIRPRKAQK